MKTAVEWVQWFEHYRNASTAEIQQLIGDIKQIQTDALMEAHRLVMIRDEQAVVPDCGVAAEDIMELTRSINK